MQDTSRVFEESLEELCDEVRSKRKSGIFGETGPEVPDEQRDRDAEHIELIIKNIVDALNDMNDNRHAKQSKLSFPQAIVSFIFRPYSRGSGREHDVEERVEELLHDAGEATTTTARFRERYEHIYRAVFYEILPGLTLWNGSVNENSQAERSSISTAIGPWTRFAQSPFQFRIYSKTLDTVHEQDKQFVSLSAKMTALLDIAWKQREDVGDTISDTILEAAEVFQVAMIASQSNISVRMSAGVFLTEAAAIIAQLDKFVRSRRSMQSSIALILMKGFTGAAAPMHLKEALGLLRELDETKGRIEQMKIRVKTMTTHDATTKTSLKELGVAASIDDEIKLTRALMESPHINSQPSVQPSELTFQKVAKRLEDHMKVVKFDRQHNEQHMHRNITCREGAFADVYKITLPEPMEHTFSFCRQPGQHEIWTRWSVDEAAVKVIRFTANNSEQTAALRVLREYEAWSILHHPNILPLIGIWFNFDPNGLNKSPAFVSPWLERDHLRYYLTSKPWISRKKRLCFLIDVADALAYMHNHKPCVCHGDVNARNILVLCGRAFICDFGISHVLNSVHGLTSDPHGHWRFRAPERLECCLNLKPTPQSDMYSFGSLFFEVMTGVVPWKDKAEGARILNKHATEPRPERMRDEDYNFLKYCWKIDPRIRATANIAVEELKNLIALKDM